jgi:hypothetical protein
MKLVRRWLAGPWAKTLCSKGVEWGNSYYKSLNGKLRDECLIGQIFYSIKKVSIVTEQHFNTIRPH